MKSKNWNAVLAALSCVGMLVPQAAFAVPAGAKLSDVALHENGVVFGQVVDAQGVAVAMTPVAIASGGKEIARTQTDSTGKFSVSGLKGGVYQVAAAGHQGVYRMWAPRTAPPAAQQGLMVVSQGDLVRGQGAIEGHFQGVMSWVSQHPIMTAGLIAGAIAIPIALTDDDSPATP
ncbi:MAG: carboxypeptidase regulatory-like domain-containing protein [Planctomycetes bacterium]|nr:carboxypeptidase regulatory-like domain-containing protein [Planctomycetota bacterium]